MRRAFAVAVLMMTGAVALAASRPAEEQSKIDWLIDQVGSSGATFIRNGQSYEAKKAVSHLKQKLWFAGKRVQTARDFIVGVASHSEESGKIYEVRFADGKQRPLGDWLTERLMDLEKGKAVPEKGAARK
jgi:hypothetical protein